MPASLIPILLDILTKLGKTAYEKAVELWFHPSPSKADFLAVSDAALSGSALQDELAAKDRADRKAGTGAYAGQGPQP